MNLPNNTQIELVEGCNRMCKFCGIYGIWKHKKDRKIKKMDLDFAINLSQSFGRWWKDKGKRIEFAMHGEPTLHPNLLEIINKFRLNNPLAQMQMTTNGSRLTTKLVRELFKSGLNILLIDLYDEKTSKKCRCVLENIGIKVTDYYSPNSINPYYYKNSTDQNIILIGDLATENNKKRTRKILNHAGNVNPKYWDEFNILPVRQPLQKKCSRPFRELAVHWDGTVPICCIDWKHEFIVGKYPDDGELWDLWESKIMNTVRYLLFEKQRWFRPCYKCDYNGGFRLGLLDRPIMGGHKSFIKSELENHFIKMKKYAHHNQDSYFKLIKNIKDHLNS